MIVSFAGRENMWVMVPPKIDPMIAEHHRPEDRHVHSITHFAITSKIMPRRIYQSK